MQRVLRWIAVLSACGMFVVLVTGARVTNTGSGHGCGNTWPLCRGQLIPQFAVATLIEWSHRAVTAPESLLIIAFAVLLFALYRQRREARVLAPLMVVFLFAQAILGAIAAGTHETPAVLALHFGVSLVSFSSIVLAGAFVFEYNGKDSLRDIPVSLGIRRLIIATLVLTYIDVYLGAYVVHRGASFACPDWPLCQGSLFPNIHSYLVLVQFMHRMMAVLLVLVIMSLWLATRQIRANRPDLYFGSLAALISVVLQSLSGAFLISARLDLFSRLLHAALVSLLFASACYLVYHLVPRRICLPRHDSTLLTDVAGAQTT